ncbi:MAG: hypothetical protein F4Y78_05285 [Candidatus Dadabacteria bacterium]|nr:hypothetical protein [Candidatus Dadabacteria bacterium]MYA47970.1 hypothetical protein [Candidatus Dadabacteria bacterium]MYF47570.1 hypothetical protein [Candidatus Dadabacteria bacterium]MYG82843.1 hypothetical protein [Candidatus Dadabacteria bacterium]MYK49160.1 hypothetical protein [Candidatus Dadabacteria bacterium]
MKILAVFFLAVMLLAPSCRRWENPATSMISADKSVAVLILNPSVYTMQEVRVKGKVWEIETMGEPAESVIFKLADSEGNYITVVWEKELSFAEGDIVEAAGLFDSNFISSENRFDPKLAAKAIRILKED